MDKFKVKTTIFSPLRGKYRGEMFCSFPNFSLQKILSQKNHLLSFSVTRIYVYHSSNNTCHYCDSNYTQPKANSSCKLNGYFVTANS